MSEGFPFWVWLFGGLALCAAETIIPGAFLIWIGAAGLVARPPRLTSIRCRSRRRRSSSPRSLRFWPWWEDGSMVRSRRKDLLQREVAPRRWSVMSISSIQPIERGFGRIRVGDSVWRVSGPDLPAGAKVRVVSAEGGADLHVEKA